MSDRFGFKVKENAGKTKYSSLNLNQTYKGTKVETKTTSGAARHGLQSLGKVGASRRIPPPANLPSLKSENSGNDPTVSLVPSGGGGWGSAKEKASENAAVASQPAPPSSTPQQVNAPITQQPLLQPQRPVPPPSHPQTPPQPQSQNSGQSQTQPVKQKESQTKTWGSVSSNGAGGPGRTYSHQEMPYFNREFPVLGGGNSGERMPPSMEEKDLAQYGPRPVMRNTHEPAWMEHGSTGPRPSDYGPGRERPEVYNGGPGYAGGPQSRRPPDFQNSPAGRNYSHGHPPQHGSGPHGYGPVPGRHGYPPDFYARGPIHKPGTGTGPGRPGNSNEGRGEGYTRPAILKPEDIQAMADNDEEEEGGWAGAQHEVDYGAKLEFEDFDDDDKPPADSSRVKSDIDSTSNKGEPRWQSNDSRSGEPPPTKQAWSEGQVHPHQYPEGRQLSPKPGMKPFDSRGSHPAPGWPMPYSKQMPAQQRGGPAQPQQTPPDQDKQSTKEEEPVVNEWQKRRVKQQEEMRAAVERARKRREEEELRRQTEQKAAAIAKLKELELKKARRESAKEGDDAWAEELDSIEKDAHIKEPLPDQRVSESPEREQEPQNPAFSQHENAVMRNDNSERLNRPRNDSESSDASRSSVSRGASRPHHHPPRDIPPRFQQQQQLRHQQQQQQHSQPHYQQPHPYPQQHQAHHQQLSRSPHQREFQEGPLAVSSHYPAADSGPISPSQPVKTDLPVKRIMKRSDSSSTAGDDIPSVKSLESGSSEQSKESEKRPPAAPKQPVVDKAEEVREHTKDGSVKDKQSERKPGEDLDLPVFEDEGRVESDEATHGKLDATEKPKLSQSDKEKVIATERAPEKKERKDGRDTTRKPAPEKTSQSKERREDRREDRRDERRNLKRDTRHYEKRSEDPKDLGKRKREESDEGGYIPDRRGRFLGRDDSKRERFSESRGRGRVSFPVRGHGRGGVGTSSSSYRGRGRGERGGRDNREFREPKPSRSREAKPSSHAKSLEEEQKPSQDNKEKVVVEGSSSTPEGDMVTERVGKNVESFKQKDKEDALLGEKDKVSDRKDEKVIIEEKKDLSVQQENREESNTESSSKQGDQMKKSDNNKEVANLKPKGRGGFGKPPQSSEDSKRPHYDDKKPGGKRYPDRRRANDEKGRNRGEYYEEKRFSRNYSRDQHNQRSAGRDTRNREKEQTPHSQHDNRDTGTRWYSQEDRRKRFGERDDEKRFSRAKVDGRNPRGTYRSPYPTRGRLSKPPMRPSTRGGRSSQPVGSGRFSNNYRRSKSTDEELSDDDYESDSSSYTTATSASEERRDDKTPDKESDLRNEKESSSDYDRAKAPSRSNRSPLRGKVSTRAGPRGAGGFGRSRREVERPPRFQKQQERERAGFPRGVSRGGNNEGSEIRPGRGRGRGRGKREQLSKSASDSPGIPVTEDWDDEAGVSVKEGNRSSGGKMQTGKESSSRKGFTSSRSSTDRTRRDKSRESGDIQNTSARREPFLVERQQAKAEGSKFSGGEPRGPLPAARNGFSKDGNRRSDAHNSLHSTGLDNINTGISESNKAVRKQDAPARKTDIQQFDLHNIAGVICIDDMTDDDSDISSTLSGFVEVTSRRSQKENKDRQREEEERKKKSDEQNRQRSNQSGNKKNQSSKPPRFSKQHTPQANVQNKAAGVTGKSVSSALSEAVAGITNTASNSNASSASSTKRNSPVTVERPMSPAPPPVFNAWDKPLNIVTPAKPQSVAPQVTAVLPDPLAVGSGKPSSSRATQSGTVMPPVPSSLIEDASVDEDYIAMTKEIALLAPPEEPDESEEPTQTVTTTKPNVENVGQTTEKVSKRASDKTSQPKPQREKAPRFDRTSKRRVAGNGEEARREPPAVGKGSKSGRENLGFQKPRAKAPADIIPKRKNQAPSSSTQQPSPAAKDQTPDGVKSNKDVQEREEHDVLARIDASDEGSGEKEDLKESEGQEVKDDSGSESSRKDSEPDVNVDSSERNSDADNLFSPETLTVDIHERSSSERPVREPSPVSPAIFEMSKKMEASRKLWDSGLDIGRPGHQVAAWEETLRTSASVSSSIVGMPVVESNDLRLSEEQVTVSKQQCDLDTNSSKAESKSSDGVTFSKKGGSGEQQNVCKVKPQQQQQASVKPQQTNAMVAQTSGESRPNELNTAPLSQPLLTQEQLLAQQAIPQRYAFPFVNPLVDLQQRQPFLRQQQLQQLQEASQSMTPTYPITHVQEMNQTRSSSSPLSQAAQDIYQSSFLTGGVYSAGSFQGAQPFVSIALLPSTTTQSYVNSTPATQKTTLMGIQNQQTKTTNGSVFPHNVNPQAGQTMYMPFDPKSLSGGAALFNLPQHPPTAQRHILSTQPGLVGDNVPRQGGFPTPQPTPQPFQATFPFQQKQVTYDVSQDVQMKQKLPDQTSFSRQSELVKHVNAKPFEPPKRSTPGTGSTGNAAINPLMSSAFVRNANLMTIRPSAPEMSGPSQSPPVSTSMLSGRPVSVSPVDPSVPFPGAVGTFPKHPTMSQFQVQQQAQTAQPQQFTPFQQQAIGIQHPLQVRPQGQQQQQAVNPLQGSTATILSSPAVLAATIPRQLLRAPGLGTVGMGGPQPNPNAQRFPTPIQRPMAASLMHGMPHVQALRGPRPQSTPPPMIPAKQQQQQQQPASTRPQIPQAQLLHQDPVAAAFKIEQHHKMLEQTRMFFSQQGQHQQRIPPQSILDDQQAKAIANSQADKPNVKAQAVRETPKLQDKKEEVNPRNRKTSSEQPNKMSKTTKADSKPDESSKDKNTKQDGKGAVANSTSSANSGSGVAHIHPINMHSRIKSNRPRGPPRMPGMPPNKPKLSGRPEKDVRDAAASEQRSQSQSPKNSEQAKASDVQPVSPLAVNQ